MLALPPCQTPAPSLMLRSHCGGVLRYQARMYAQFGAVAALLATAALSQLDEPKAVTLPDGKVILPSALPAQHKY